jgi:transcriptional regulator with XRE-family HTH domain
VEAFVITTMDWKKLIEYLKQEHGLSINSLAQLTSTSTSTIRALTRGDQSTVKTNFLFALHPFIDLQILARDGLEKAIAAKKRYPSSFQKDIKKIDQRLNSLEGNIEKVLSILTVLDIK